MNPSRMLRSKRGLATLAVLEAACLVGGVVSAAALPGPNHHVAHVTGSAGSSAAASIAPTVAPTSAASTAPTTPAYSPPPSLGFVLGPDVPVTPHTKAQVDLEDRMLVLNEEDAVGEPADLVHGGFRTLDQLVATFDASDRPTQRQYLVEDGYEGSYLKLWILAAKGEILTISLYRFTTNAGAFRHLSGFTEGPSDEKGLAPVTTALPDSVAFTGPSPLSGRKQALLYLARGRYFAIIKVLSGNYGASTAKGLVGRANEVGRALRLRLG